MANEPLFDVSRSALLAMDCQQGIIAMSKLGNDFTLRASSVVKAARGARVPVIHIQVGFRPSFPEISENNRLFAGIRASAEYQKFFQGPSASIHPALGPEPNDIVITKHRVSAFTGTDLDMILRAKGIQTLVLFGIATSGVVLSTLLHATDADYRLAVIEDCCADTEPALHEALLRKLFPRRADVLSSDSFLKMLNAA
jgi:nicotinamidase-related amidase